MRPTANVAERTGRAALDAPTAPGVQAVGARGTVVALVPARQAAGRSSGSPRPTRRCRRGRGHGANASTLSAKADVRLSDDGAELSVLRPRASGIAATIGLPR